MEKPSCGTIFVDRRRMRKSTTILLALTCVLASLLFSCKKETDPSLGQQRVNGTPSEDFYLENKLPVQKRITHKITGMVGGYLEALPASYAEHPEKYYPLIIYLHGKGGIGTGSYDDLKNVEENAVPKLIKHGYFPPNFTVGGKDYQFIVISPQFNGWTLSPDIDAVVDYAISKYRVDQKRIYMSGQSMGGGGTWDYAIDHGKRLAAIAPIAGASWPTQDKGKAIANSGVCVWAFHCKNDPTVPSWYSINYVDYINLYNPIEPAKVTLFSGTEHSIAWNTATDPNYKENGVNMYEWMLSKCRTN